MNRKIEVEFVEDAAVEIRATSAAITTAYAPDQRTGRRRHFWLGWQLFGAE